MTKVSNWEKAFKIPAKTTIFLHKCFFLSARYQLQNYSITFLLCERNTIVPTARRQWDYDIPKLPIREGMCEDEGSGEGNGRE